MARKLSIEEVTERYKSAGFELIGEWINTDTNTLIRHQECGFEWKPRPYHIFNGHGCPQCYGNVLLSQEEVVQRFEDKGYKLLDEYKNNRTSVLIEHIECGFEWKAFPNNIFKGHGCPLCAGNKPLTNEIINMRYKNAGFELLGEWKGVNVHTLIRHIECGFEWKPRPYKIFSGRGCPRCAGKLPITKEIAIERYKAAGVELIGEWVNASTHTLIRHQECGFEWSPIPENSIFQDRGCPKCAGNLSLTQEMAYQRFKDRGYELLGEYENSDTPTLTKHIECGFEWRVIPGNIFSGGGCPQCPLGKNEKLVGKLLMGVNIVVEAQKSIKYLDRQNNKRRMRFDFYLPKINIAIEYNGKQHYQPVCFGGISLEIATQNFADQQIWDRNKQQYCDNNNITLIWIDGRKYKGIKLEKYMAEELIPHLQQLKLAAGK